ncbi:MAG: biotin--[acetyl-CoA-carboxylase] ligase, partial [Actinobacteria bacterium]|nr:biotin--[acetyl-CoA-carboxylase] ligase [Actinomycetota bacterium]
MEWDIRRFGELDSTNRWLLDAARDGAPEGTVAVADHQTAGRGRLGRTWVAPPGASLLMSILLRPRLPPERLHLATAAVALSAAAALDGVAGFRPGLKWPNDLVVDDRKLAGVLTEIDGPNVVPGIGINVNWPPDLPDELALIATAVNHVAGREIDRDALLVALLVHLSDRYGHWSEVAKEYRASCATLHRVVRVDLPDESFTGTAADVTDDGHLIVETSVCLRTVSAGDVV